MAGSPPQYVTPPPDPLFQQLTQQAQQDNVNALQTQAAGDTASLMARYGSLVGLTGAAAPSTANPSTLPIGMALNVMSGTTAATPIGQVARAA